LQMSHSSTSYNKISDWYMPRTSQLMTLHPIWASQIIWAKLRNEVINNHKIYSEEFQ